MPNRSVHARFLAMAVLIGAFSTISTPIQAQAQGTVITVPTSIDATGGTDVTADLNNFLTLVPDGATVQFPEGGRYRIEGTVRIVDANGLTIEGNQSMLYATSNGGLRRMHVEIVGGSSIRIHNLAIKGPHPNGGIEDGAYQPDYEGQHGFAVRGTNGINFDHVAVTDNYGDFIYLSSDESRNWAQRVWIHDSVFARNGRQGITIEAARNVVIEDNQFDEVARTTFDIEPNGPGGGGENVHILTNNVGTGRLLLLAAGGLGSIKNVIVSRNKLTGHMLNVGVWPPRGNRNERFWIVGNRGGNSANVPPIRVDRTDGLVVWRNSQPTRDGEAGVIPTRSCGVNVSENNFGAFTKQMEPLDETCGEQLGPVPPDPPEVFGRPTGPEPEPQLPGKEEPDLTETSTPKAIVAIQSEDENWSITVTLAILAAFMVGAALLVRVRRN